jgi:hypothetical protein
METSGMAETSRLIDETGPQLALILGRGSPPRPDLMPLSTSFPAEVPRAAAATGGPRIEAVMAYITLADLTQFITPLAAARGDTLAAAVAEHTGISTRRARAMLRELTALGWLACKGRPQRPRYRPGALRQGLHRYAIDGLAEDRAWARALAPLFDTLPAEARRMAQHAFTELLNNAIDHSGGSTVTVSMRQTATQMQLLVSDDGRGPFDKIADDFEIADPFEAVFDLAKGKLTGAPDRHTGRSQAASWGVNSPGTPSACWCHRGSPSARHR